MHKICFTISLFHASTCFEHHVLIVRRSKFYYTTSGIITLCRWPSRARDSHLYVWWYQRLYNTICPPDDKHMCSKHVEAWNKFIIKFSASSWLILINKYIETHGQQNIKTPHMFAVLVNFRHKLVKSLKNYNTHTTYRSTLTWWGL